MKAQYGSKKKYHFLYKTTNLINGKFYYGMHSTDDLQDGYIGSGTLLKRSINKYGVENFHIEILEFFDSREALVEAEKELVTETQVQDLNCMNLKPGGRGGFDREISLRGASNRSAKMLADPERRDRWIKACNEGKERAYREGRRVSPWKGKPGPFTNKKHSLQTIEKMKTSHKGQGSGSANSQFGSKWITNEIDNRKIKNTSDIPDGWRLGRKLNRK